MVAAAWAFAALPGSRSGCLPDAEDVTVTATAGVTTEVDLRAEFERQVDGLVAKGYARLAGLGDGAFRDRLAPLVDRLDEIAVHSGQAAPPSTVPFVVVAGPALVAPHDAVRLLELRGKPGFTDMDAGDLERFVPTGDVELPAGDAYLLVDADTGPDTLDVTPDDALPRILARGRSPLTVAEGLALVTHHPDVLRAGNCFSMLGSRCGDRRVTALWVSKGRPRLGWCWAGNPHTWLGSASCARRLGTA